MDTIVLWSIKTAMMDVLASPEPVNTCISPHLMKWFYEHRQPPPHGGVWMGFYNGRLSDEPQAARLIPRRGDALHAESCKIFTFCDWTATFGHLALKVILPPMELWNTVYTLEFDEPKPLVPLYGVPVLTSYNWPPRAGYVEPEVLVLSHAMSGMRIEVNAPQSA
jgi:hypothetical protein